MLNSTVKTYACKKATPNSKNITANKERIENTNNKKLKDIEGDKKLLIIWTSVWPAIILALNLIAILKARIPWEKISIGIKINNDNKGDSGIYILKKKKHLAQKYLLKIQLNIM